MGCRCWIQRRPLDMELLGWRARRPVLQEVEDWRSGWGLRSSARGWQDPSTGDVARQVWSGMHTWRSRRAYVIHGHCHDSRWPVSRLRPAGELLRRLFAGGGGGAGPGPRGRRQHPAEEPPLREREAGRGRRRGPKTCDAARASAAGIWRTARRSSASCTDSPAGTGQAAAPEWSLRASSCPQLPGACRPCPFLAVAATPSLPQSQVQVHQRLSRCGDECRRHQCYVMGAVDDAFLTRAKLALNGRT